MFWTGPKAPPWKEGNMEVVGYGVVGYLAVATLFAIGGALREAILHHRRLRKRTKIK
ncbi:MAG: hypothetical protein WC862_00200 [Patescibacteria group bacterium]